MQLHQVKDTNGNIVGETANVAELNQFLRAHPGYQSQPLPGEVTTFNSTLPKLQEDPVKPDGDFLRQ